MTAAARSHVPFRVPQPLQTALQSQSAAGCVPQRMSPGIGLSARGAPYIHVTRHHRQSAVPRADRHRGFAAVLRRYEPSPSAPRAACWPVELALGRSFNASVVAGIAQRRSLNPRAVRAEAGLAPTPGNDCGNLICVQHRLDAAGCG